jgi:radical SAM protein with 4Fe4S-binding SPASM domain
MNGLSVVNIELTNKCQKNCWMCGRRKAERDYPELYKNYNQDMSLDLLDLIANHIPRDIVIQFHNNGEPLIYLNLGKALDRFPNNIKCLNTNGILLLEKANEIINKLDTLTISVIENGPEEDEQYEIVQKFLELKGTRKPYMIYRLLGNVINNSRWRNLPGLICTRILHNPMGSFNYTKKVTIPEIGICLDLLNHLAIDIDGNVSICVRFDPHKYGVLGNIQNESLRSLWDKKKYYIQEHLKGNRKCNQLCATCDFYGCPTGV